MKNPLAILIILLWLLLGFWYYTSYNSCCRNKADSGLSDGTANAAAVEMKKESGPLLFNYSKEGAITGEGWEDKRKGLIAGLSDNQRLEIMGLYRSDETNNTKFENLGIARANEVRKLFPELADDKVNLLSRLVDGPSPDKVNPFSSCEFASRINTANVKEIADHVDIYFPYNSTNKINSKEVEAYLDDVADKVIKSGEKVSLTGHTDSDGSDASNLALGQRRADIIKRYLLSRKVAEAQIISQSKGEAEPKASNDKEEGKAQNRRTELKIIK